MLIYIPIICMFVLLILLAYRFFKLAAKETQNKKRKIYRMVAVILAVILVIAILPVGPMLFYTIF